MTVIGVFCDFPRRNGGSGKDTDQARHRPITPAAAYASALTRLPSPIIPVPSFPSRHSRERGNPSPSRPSAAAHPSDLVASLALDIRTHQQLVDLAAIHVDNLEPPALLAEMLAFIGQAAQHGEGEARDGRIIAILG